MQRGGFSKFLLGVLSALLIAWTTAMTRGYVEFKMHEAEGEAQYSEIQKMLNQIDKRLERIDNKLDER